MDLADPRRPPATRRRGLDPLPDECFHSGTSGLESEHDRQDASHDHHATGEPTTAPGPTPRFSFDRSRWQAPGNGAHS